jgi:hypothetical protein
MSESSSPADGAPRHPTETDGWFLPKDSWGFHRSAFRLLGRPLAFGEYTLLRGQITWGQAELLRFGGREGVYRVRLRDGAVLDVLARTYKRKADGKVWHTLMRAMRPQSKPRSVAPSASAPEAAAPLPTPPVAIPLPPPEPIRRASTLSLGPSARTAAEILAARLQPKPPPPRLESIPTKKAGQQPGQTPARKPPPKQQRAKARR